MALHESPEASPENADKYAPANDSRDQSKPKGIGGVNRIFAALGLAAASLATQGCAPENTSETTVPVAASLADAKSELTRGESLLEESREYRDAVAAGVPQAQGSVENALLVAANNALSESENDVRELKRIVRLYEMLEHESPAAIRGLLGEAMREHYRLVQSLVFPETGMPEGEAATREELAAVNTKIEVYKSRLEDAALPTTTEELPRSIERAAASYEEFKRVANGSVIPSRHIIKAALRAQRKGEVLKIAQRVTIEYKDLPIAQIEDQLRKTIETLDKEKTALEGIVPSDEDRINECKKRIIALEGQKCGLEIVLNEKRMQAEKTVTG